MGLERFWRASKHRFHRLKTASGPAIAELNRQRTSARLSPEIYGIELARRASELDPDIKIMFITGFAAVALNSDSEAPKNAKVLAKPVHLRELVSEVNKMLAA